VADSCERGNELSGSVKGDNFVINRSTVSFSRKTLSHEMSYKILEYCNLAVLGFHNTHSEHWEAKLHKSAVFCVILS
jgi:hypothetical protein